MGEAGEDLCTTKKLGKHQSGDPGFVARPSEHAPRPAAAGTPTGRVKCRISGSTPNLSITISIFNKILHTSEFDKRWSLGLHRKGTEQGLR